MKNSKEEKTGVEKAGEELFNFAVAVRTLKWLWHICRKMLASGWSQLNTSFRF
jgi:hypothetical protein